MPVNTRFVLLLAFVHFAAFVAAAPLEPRRMSDTVIEDGTPLGVTNRYHHFANARDGLALARSSDHTHDRRATPPPISALGTASRVIGKRIPDGPPPGPPPPGPPPGHDDKIGPLAAPPAPPSPPPGVPGPPGPPGPPFPYPYPFPYPIPEREHEREREHEYPHEFHGHEQEFIDHESEHVYHDYYPSSHRESHYPHDEYPRPHRDDYPYDDYPSSHEGYARYHHYDDDDFAGPPRDHYPRPHEYGHYHHEGHGDEFEEHYRGQHPPQRSDRPGGGPEIASEGKRPNSISLPQASSVDLASASLPPRDFPGSSPNRFAERHMGSHGSDGQLGTRENASQSSTGSQPVNGAQAANAGPAISSLFSDLGNRGGSHVPEARESQDIALPVPGSMNLGHFETRGNDEMNEIAVQDHRNNPVEKVVTL